MNMRKITFTLLISAFAIVNVNAQKMMTRTGKISFFSSTPIENIEAFNNDVSCILNIENGEIVFIVPVKSFKFEKSLMQEHFNEDYMESDKYPKANFKGQITNISDVNFSKNGSYSVKVQGKLSMHGVTHDITIPGTIIVKDGKATATTKFKIKTDDYNIQIPSIAANKIAKEIEITVNSILENK